MKQAFAGVWRVAQDNLASPKRPNAAGFESWQVQVGAMPSDFNPFPRGRL